MIPISSTPVLALPRTGLPFSLITDARHYQAEAALFQSYPDGARKSIGFCSKSLNAHEKNLSAPEREFLAVVRAVQSLSLYCQGHLHRAHRKSITVLIDGKKNQPRGRLMRWCLRLREFDFDILYCNGYLNSQTDICCAYVL